MIKIYELAKQIGVKAGDLAKAAKEEFGLDKAGNFTVLSEEQASMLASAATGKESPGGAAEQPKPQLPDSPVVEHVATPRPKRRRGASIKAPAGNDENRAMLERNRARAAELAKAHPAGVRPFVSIATGRRQKPAVQPAQATPPPAEATVVDASAIEAPKAATVKPEPMAEATKAVEVSGEGKAAPAKPAASSKTRAADRGDTAKASDGEPLDLNFAGFGQFGGDSQTQGGSSVVFHPAEADDFEDDDYDRGNSRDDDYDSDDDIQREYFGGRRLGGSQPLRHHRDDGRDEGERGGRVQHGSKAAQHGAKSQQRAVQGGTAQGRGAQQGMRGMQAGSPTQQRPVAQPAFPTRPGVQSAFPTRPGAQSAFPTRPGAQSAFPTRPGVQSAFPTRPGAQSAFPTRQGQAPQRMGLQNGRNGKPMQQPTGKNFPKGAQNMSKNLRQGTFASGAKPPVAPPPASQSSPVVGEKIISLKGPTLIRELAEMMDMRPNRVIADLMREKMLVSINQRVEVDTAGKIAAKYGFTVELEKAKRSTERKPEIRRLDEDDDIPEDKPEDMRPRPPVVTFLGHVDHGKTSLLDYIRKTKVAAGEAGGITQHIGAYSVDINDRKITFLDTPGHAAFSAMRARGAKLTDIAVIVVAADDGIMPQTREVIKQCRQAGVQMMVAINKCDLPSAKPDRVRQQLQGEGLTPEDWGGDIVCCEVSAHTGAGMDNLLEMILLQADVLELQANPNRRADGYVIEAQMERGIGPTATLLVSSGALKVGDVVLIDDNYGRLRALIDDRGNQVKSVGPAQAVRVMGLSGVPEAGAEFRVMTSEKRARELADRFAMERKAQELQKAQKAVNLDAILDRLGTQTKKQLSVIVKADTQGTVEAIVDHLKDIRSDKISLEILGSSIGNVTANDVQRAAAGHAMIVGFQVNTEAGVAPIATHDGVRINTFRIIYELFDFVKQSLLDMLDPEYREVVKGHAQIRQIFDIGKLGKVAGCQLLDGSVIKTAFVRIKRLRDIVFQGRISSLKHFKDEVSEVKDMQEFGVSFVDFEGFAEGDVIECYAMEELERTL